MNFQRTVTVSKLVCLTVGGQSTTSVDRGGNTIGVLGINATSANNTGANVSSATRLEGDVGRFAVNDSCTGGTLTMNLSSRPIQYDFWFYNNNQSMYVIGTTPGFPMTGTAHVGVTGCPAGLMEPLSLVNGLYTAKLRRWPFLPSAVDAYALAGLVGATVGRDRANNPLGVLAIEATSTVGREGSVTRVETDAGRYQVYPDCTGGTLTFNLSSRPVQHEFYFRAGFQTLDVISTTGPPSYGVLTRY